MNESATPRVEIRKRNETIDGKDMFAERAKQCYYVSGMGEKVVKTGAWIAAIDWEKWLDKLC
ncbi:MAG: hypothetical protein JJE30_17545 [Desulfuromonadales bacterium]|nr:hypothetical protein [Desulfuromonadales bacterium]